MVVLVISYACGGSDSSNASSAPTPSATVTPPDPSGTLLRPVVPTQTPRTPTTTTRTAFTLPTTAVTGPCTDAELSLTAVATPASAKRGSSVSFTLKIKNISQRTCSRNIGADVQELRLLDGDTIIWSSDDCDNNRQQDVFSFAPGVERSFTRTWTGARSRSATGTICDSPQLPDPGVYDLVARLDQKFSEPFRLRITS